MSGNEFQMHNGNTLINLWNMSERILAAYQPKAELLGACQFEEPETSYGACDGTICADIATVYDLFGDRELCQFHFQKGAR